MEAAPIPGICRCGRRISLNKRFCKACFEAEVKRVREEQVKVLAATLTDQAALEKLLEGAPESERAMMVDMLRPHLSFTPESEAV